MKQSKQPKNLCLPQMRILLATDIHLGHAQNHVQLGNDSYNAFQEVLNIAKKQDVDFMLLGGDLFDEVNPTQKCIFKCLNLLRDNIFGDRQLSIGVKGMVPNFSNQNLNISLPIFTIHGNHDYPSNDFGKISVCDLLHASNYVNYFGKHINLGDKGQKKIIVKPIIFQKNKLSTRVALYGIGYIKDAKMHRMFQQNVVVFEQPQKPHDTLCIAIIHQNRFKGKKGGVGASYQNCVHPNQLPKWIDLIIWCHQHQAIYKIQIQSDLKIFQPGSTVVTSYIEAQAGKKQCGLITIRPQKQFQIQSILLQKSHRPLIYKFYDLADIIQKFGVDGKINFQQYFDQQLSQILGQNQIASLSRKPIIRIKIDYTGQQIIRLIKLEQKYRQLVANSFKIFIYTHKRQRDKKTLALQDKEVLDMIKGAKIPKGQGRQSQLTQEVMQAFTQELSKSKTFFFDIPKLQQSIVQIAFNEGRGIQNDIKPIYAGQLQKKYGDNVKNLQTFIQRSKQQTKRLNQKLLQSANNVINNKKQQFNLQDIKTDIYRFQESCLKKIEQTENIFNQYNKKPVPQSQAASKSTILNSNQNNQDRNSILSSNRQSDNQHKQLGRMSQSQDDDCCRRAQRQGYRQNDTKIKFQQAMAAMENKKKDTKGKKNVKFKEQ